MRKTCTDTLRPTPQQERAQERALETVLWHCRTLYTLYHVALEQRKTWWGRGTCGQGKRASSYPQQAELPDRKAEGAEYGEVHAPVLQEALLRVDRTFQACFRRVAAGETPGDPRFQGGGRSTSCTDPQVGEHGGARLDNGFLVLVLVLSKSGRIADGRALEPPLGGHPQNGGDQPGSGWLVRVLLLRGRAHVPMQPLPLTGRETGITGRDVGLQVVLITGAGAVMQAESIRATPARRRRRGCRRSSG